MAHIKIFFYSILVFPKWGTLYYSGLCGTQRYMTLAFLSAQVFKTSYIDLT